MLKVILMAMGCAAYLGGWAQFTVSGKVNGPLGPLEGATVQTSHGGHFAITNAQGGFQLDNVKAGEYVLAIRYLGYREKRESVAVNGNIFLTIAMEEDAQLTDEVTVYATRAAEKSPTTFTNINKEALEKQNFGQDLPFVLNYSPSLITTSDAGAGVGYTGLRIRGSDATRINVTINGIPYNDSET
ncbi:MAG TPA: TonB-dependent receptor, partial [Cyclobacteriaceae bacterium]|nr:TonB-dependent receptor [Cyclobacteriaceae bacterium]